MTMPKSNAMRAMGHNRDVERRMDQFVKLTEDMVALVAVVGGLKDQVAHLENRVAELEARD
jgi:hypothetical protein